MHHPVRTRARRGVVAAGAARAGHKKKTEKRHALPRVVFVVGPTSSGKTKLGLRLAAALNGEVINADARQIYRDVDIGTGKPRGKRLRRGSQTVYMVEGVAHHLMDVIPPEKQYSVAEWRDDAMKAIRSVIKRGKLPIVVGGTGLYVSALIDNYQFPKVEAQPAMREALASKTLDELVQALLVADPAAQQIVDLKNKRRVIRALEVVTFSGQKFSEVRGKAEPLVDAFQVGLRLTPEDLYERMERSINRMFREGLVHEVEGLLKKGIPMDVPAMTSIGYSDVARHLNGELSLDDVRDLIKRRTRQYTKRQWTWFKRDHRIHWAESDDEALKSVNAWVKKAA
jgi:tRNA dimethylallyltransferase